jgi:hypothetical protein
MDWIEIFETILSFAGGGFVVWLAIWKWGSGYLAGRMLEKYKGTVLKDLEEHKTKLQGSLENKKNELSKELEDHKTHLQRNQMFFEKKVEAVQAFLKSQEKLDLNRGWLYDYSNTSEVRDALLSLVNRIEDNRDEFKVFLPYEVWSKLDDMIFQAKNGFRVAEEFKGSDEELDHLRPAFVDLLKNLDGLTAELHAHICKISNMTI